jgi:hypothetical protein
MVLKIADGIPMVWRTPTSVQFGVDAPVIVDGVTPGVERVLAALRSGISTSGLEMLARDAGLPAAQLAAVLRLLEPVMRPRPPAPAGRVLVTGDGPLAVMVAALLREAGALARSDDTMPAIAVLVADWVVGPDDAARWLRRDITHLPIVLTDSSADIGPFIEPGGGPCVYCLHLARTDADPAWPAVATQLWGRAGAEHSQLMQLSVACFAARRILARLESGPSTTASAWRIADEGGAVSAWTARTHPRCSCAAPPETDWAPGSARADLAATSSVTGAAAHV